MSFGAAISSCLGNYATFSGRASRSEFWWFLLFTFVLQIALSILSGVLPPVMIVYIVVMLALFLPSLAVYARRMHDLDRSGWWILIFLVPLLNIIMVLVWYTQRGTQGDNQFGPDPLA